MEEGMYASIRVCLASAGALLIIQPAYAQVSAAVSVPEPAAWMTMAVGIVGVAIAAHRNRRK
jgi:hypothetical protein